MWNNNPHNLVARDKPIQEATGGVLIHQDNWIPIICGGRIAGTQEANDKCFSLAHAYNHDFDIDNVMPSQLRVARIGAASLPIANGEKLMVTGGYKSDSPFIRLIDIVHVKQLNTSSTYNPFEVSSDLYLPTNLRYHCLVRIGPEVAMLIGGQDEKELSYGYSQIINFESLEWSHHALSTARSKHACGVLKVPGENGYADRKIVIAAGGIIYQFYQLVTATVDMVVVVNNNTDKIDLSWNFAEEEMPEPVTMASAATTVDQSRLFIVGGLLEYEQHNLGGFEVSCSSGSFKSLPKCQWKIIGQIILNEPSMRGLALILPPLAVNSDLKAQNLCDPFDSTRREL